MTGCAKRLRLALDEAGRAKNGVSTGRVGPASVEVSH